MLGDGPRRQGRRRASQGAGWQTLNSRGNRSERLPERSARLLAAGPESRANEERHGSTDQGLLLPGYSFRRCRRPATMPTPTAVARSSRDPGSGIVINCTAQEDPAPWEESW
ncbi:MAG: hypothetical protein AW07_02777 [Candidatus Accumulibacter sp. SK-11]|nr:MAG: hypothetical protein AW07_02777 [Candidatus Accumulibacter sp. SK-11]